MSKKKKKRNSYQGVSPERQNLRGEGMLIDSPCYDSINIGKIYEIKFHFKNVVILFGPNYN